MLASQGLLRPSKYFYEASMLDIGLSRAHIRNSQPLLFLAATCFYKLLLLLATTIHGVTPVQSRRNGHFCSLEKVKSLQLKLVS